MINQCLLGCVEISAAATFHINDGVLNKSYTVSRTVYPNILYVFHLLKTQMASDGITLGFCKAGQYASSGHHLYLKKSSWTVNPVISGDLADLLGMNLHYFSLSDHCAYANHKPRNSWFPEYHSSDNNQFIKKSGEVFKGAMGTDGSLSGINFEASYERTVSWPWQSSTNSIKYSENSDSSVVNFEDFINSTRTIITKEPASKNKNIKGLYLIEDWNFLVNYLASYNDIFISKKYASCVADVPVLKMSDGENRNYLDCSVKLTLNKKSW